MIHRLLSSAVAAFAFTGAAAAQMSHEHAATGCNKPTLACATKATPAFASDGTLWLAWQAAGYVMVASSGDGGKTFTTAVAVNREPLDLDWGPDARPKIAVDRNGRVHVAFAMFRDKAFNGEVFSTISADGGRTFAPPRPVTADQESQRFEAIALDADGSLFAAWLDKRNRAPGKARNQDYVGAALASLTTADVHLVWRTRDAVMTSTGLPIVPTADFSECPEDLDVLFVPGGLKGSIALMNDDAVLDFLIDRARRAKYVTSVCTGSLVLAAAGLLKGYRATSHWYVRDLLPQMGAIADHGRVVIDRNRVTGGGVTAGLDFGLTLAALLRSADDACRIELVLEYAPAPPFHAGTPEEVGEALTREVLAGRAPMLASAREAAARAAKRLLQ